MFIDLKVETFKQFLILFDVTKKKRKNHLLACGNFIEQTENDIS